jgi:hypothetical protein
MAQPIPAEKKICSPTEVKVIVALLIINQPRPTVRRTRPAKMRSVKLCWRIASNMIVQIKGEAR